MQTFEVYFFRMFRVGTEKYALFGSVRVPLHAVKSKHRMRFYAASRTMQRYIASTTVANRTMVGSIIPRADHYARAAFEKGKLATVLWRVERPPHVFEHHHGCKIVSSICLVCRLFTFGKCTAFKLDVNVELVTLFWYRHTNRCIICNNSNERTSVNTRLVDDIII